MPRAVCSIAWSIGIAVSIIGTHAGCAHMIENRAITEFAASLKAQDYDGLKEATSDAFNKRALRTATALEDLKILHIPSGNTSIVSVEEVSKDKKRVTVEVGPDKKEVFYELTRDESGKWLVDDIYLKQKRKGLEAYKSVTEQMNLLITVREFIDSWSNGDREQVLAVAAPKFRKVLEELPPTFLAHVTRQVTSGRSSGGKFQPKASLDEKIAVVKLPRLTGETVITLELRKGSWLVSDVAIASKDEEERLPSVKSLALSVNQCIEFLTAYQMDNKDRLSQLCTDDFYNGCLSVADLSQAHLPDPQLPEHELQVRLRGNRADFTLRSESEFVQIDMQRKPETTPGVASDFVVSDVTIYEIASKQEKRLSALFTAQGMLEIFIDALAHRNLDEIKHCTSQDFSSRVWSKINDATVSSMPLETFDSTNVEFVTASFQGALTKIEVVQGGQPLTYLLRDEGGRFMVDDVQWQMSGAPSSVKTTLEVLIPIQDFASGITLGRDPDQQQQALDMIKSSCTNEFNRMVWGQTKFVPNSGLSADTFLTRAPLKAMAIGDKEVVVHLGDQQYGAKVTMRHEHGRYIVDDVTLITGPQESDRLALRHTLRTQLAKGDVKAPSPIVQASHVDAPDRKVRQANLVVPADEEKSKQSAIQPPCELDIDPFAEELPAREE